MMYAKNSEILYFVAKKFGALGGYIYICSVKRNVMKKCLLRIFLISALVCLPATMYATPTEVLEQEAAAELQNEIKVLVKGNTIRVTGAAGCTLEVYSITGARLKSVRISANDETVNPGVPRGCYIIKVGDVVRKVNLV